MHAVCKMRKMAKKKSTMWANSNSRMAFSGIEEVYRSERPHQAARGMRGGSGAWVGEWRDHCV